MKSLELPGLAAWLIICFTAASTGIQYEPGVWYAILHKPAWIPPNWVFPTVWTLLYALMAVAAWRIWRAHRLRGAPLAFAFFAAQLVFNAAWSWLFFGLHLMAYALLDLGLLWIFLLLTVLTFQGKDRLAAFLLLPYLVWVGFAGILNYALMALNP